METWTLRDRGRALAVETGPGSDRVDVRLLVDGVEVASGTGGVLDTVKLGHDDLRVRVELLWKGRARSAELIDHGDEGPPEEGDGFRVGRFGAARVPFAPPPGTRAARRHAWRGAHPHLWAARHVAFESAGILVAVLGIGALLGSLLPRLELGWLPDVDPPDWLRYLDPVRWIAKVLPDVDWFGWVPDVDLPGLGWAKYVVLIGIAIGVGVSELRKRRQREAREAAAEDTDPPISP